MSTLLSLWKSEAWKDPAGVTGPSLSAILWTRGGSWMPLLALAILLPPPPYPHHQPGWEAHVERSSEQEVSVQGGEHVCAMAQKQRPSCRSQVSLSIRWDPRSHDISLGECCRGLCFAMGPAFSTRGRKSWHGAAGQHGPCFPTSSVRTELCSSLGWNGW